METIVATVAGVALTALVGAVGWLIRAVLANATRTTRLIAAEETMASKEDLHRIELAVADKYVRRDDYVPQITLNNSKLDAIGQMVARLDDRSTPS